MDKQIIICVGISGSSKSTFATNLINKDNSFLRINRDDIRKVLVSNLHNYYNRKDLHFLEGVVNHIEVAIVSKAVTANKNIIIDNTHLVPAYIQKWINLFSNDNFFNYRDYKIKFKLFDCKLNEAKQRVAERDGLYIGFDENHTHICKETDYIDKQFEQYKQIKEWLLINYKEDII